MPSPSVPLTPPPPPFLPPQMTGQSQTSPAQCARPGFAHERALVLGVVQILAGSASIILATVAIAAMAWGYFMGTGIWAGLFFIIAGALGIVCSKRKDNCSIIAFMVMSIIAATVSMVLLGFSAAGIVVDHIQIVDKSSTSQIMVVHSLILVIALFQVISAVISSTICCKAICCSTMNDYLPYNMATPFQSGLSGYSGLQYIPSSSQSGFGQITLIPHPSTRGMFSFPHAAYIIQPAEVGNTQIMYMLPAPEPMCQPIPPPPYSSREHLDDDDTIQRSSRDRRNPRSNLQSISINTQTGQSVDSIILSSPPVNSTESSQQVLEQSHEYESVNVTVVVPGESTDSRSIGSRRISTGHESEEDKP